MIDVRSELVDNLQQGQEALETAGYNVTGYQTRIDSDRTNGITTSGETPEEAIDELLGQVGSDDNFFVQIAGDEIQDVIQGEGDPASLVYRNVTGSVEIEEPDVPERDVPGRQGTEIKYVPGTESQWQINTYDLDRKDGRERAEDAVTALEEYGLEAEINQIHP
jgi:hypothetical protein